MISIIENKYFKNSLYISVYLTEGIASLLIFTVLPIYLKNYKGLTDLSIALIASVSLLPIILKPIVAVLTDNYPIKVLGGRRRPYIIIGFIINGITLYLIGIINPLEFICIFTLLWILQSLGISLMDVTLDALVVETFPQTNEKLNANIIMQIASISSLFIILPITNLCEKNSVHIGLPSTPWYDFDIFFGGNFDVGFLIASIICISLIMCSLLMKEEMPIQDSLKVSRKTISEFIHSKYVPTLLLVFFLLQIDTGLTDFTLDPFFRIIGLRASTQLIFFSPILIVVIFGIVSSKWFIKKGIIKFLIIFTIIFAFYYCVLTILTFMNSPLTPVFYFGFGAICSFFSNCAVILYFTLAMRSAEKKVAATTLTILFVMINLGRAFGIIFAGLVPFTSYTKIGLIFLISTIIMIGRIFVFLRLKELGTMNDK